MIKKLLHTNLAIQAVYLNEDYTPFSRRRDDKIAGVLGEKYECGSFSDILLCPIGSVQTGSNKPYQKFTPFLNKAITQKVRKVSKNSYTNYYPSSDPLPGEISINDLSKFFIVYVIMVVTSFISILFLLLDDNSIIFVVKFVIKKTAIMIPNRGAKKSFISDKKIIIIKFI